MTLLANEATEDSIKLLKSIKPETKVFNFADLEKNKFDVLQSALDTLKTEVFNKKYEIGESFYFSEVYNILNRIDGVLDTKNVKVRVINSNGYSQVPFDVIQRTSADGRYIEVPTGTTWKDIMWIRKPLPGVKNEMFKIQLDWEVEGSKGKKYTVKVDDDRWSCSCPAFGWSGNSRTCKHIDKVKKDEFGL